MNRLGLMHPSTLGGRHMAETRALYEAFVRDNTLNYDAYFTSRLHHTGALVGPFGILLHSPPIGRAFLDLSTALRGLSGLKPKTREVVVLTVCLQEQAHYELYAHKQIARQQSIVESEIGTLMLGQCPATFSREEKAAYGVARELCTSTGPLSQWAWETAIIELGKDGALAVVQYVGYYRYVTTIERGFDAQVPAEGDRVENQ